MDATFDTSNNKTQVEYDNNSIETRFAELLAVGVVKIKLDRDFTLQWANTEFFNLIGYTDQEFKTQFFNKFRNIILPEDFDIFQQELNGNLIQGRINDVEFRIMSKDNVIRWLSLGVKRNKEINEDEAYGIIKDITATKDLLNKLKLQEERYHIISEITDDINFEYDIEQDCFISDERFKSTFGMDCKVTNFKSQVTNLQKLDKGSLELLLKICHELQMTKTKDYIELKIKNASEEFTWYGIHYIGMFDEYGKLIRIVGKIVNVDKQVKEKEYLLMKAQLDPMTKLYNKKTTEKQISNCLEQAGKDTQNALLIVDVDNFKMVNDTLGHLFGDAVLMDIANRIKKIFRLTDILGRIGGDEFAIFMRDVPSTKIILEKATCLCEDIVALYKNKKWSCNLSVSVGIAIGAGDSVSYKTLFKNADCALYQAKQKGKNCFKLYEPQFEQSNDINNRTLKAENKDTGVHVEQGTSYGELIKYSLGIMNHERVTENGLQKVVEMIGQTLNVGRVYIALEDESKVIHYKYQWLNPVIKNLYLLPSTVQWLGEQYNALFDVNGLFYCGDITTLTKEIKQRYENFGIKSVLETEMYYRDKKIGVLGIAKCLEKRLWVESEVEVLQMIAEILMVHIIEVEANKE